MRRCFFRLCAAPPSAAAAAAVAPSALSAAAPAPEPALDSKPPLMPPPLSTEDGVVILKDYNASQALRQERAAALKIETEIAGYPLRYKLLEARPGSALSNVKVKYLLACRKHHPGVGGDHEMFLRLSLAYQDCLKDYGLEYVGGTVRNLGNLQTDPYQAANYLKERSAITEYLPLSVLDDHIRELEEAHAKVGDALAKKIASNDTDGFWLLDDVEKVMMETGADSVVLTLLANGSIKVDSVLQLTANPLQTELLDDGKATPAAAAEPSKPSAASHASSATDAASQPKAEEKPPRQDAQAAASASSSFESSSSAEAGNSSSGSSSSDGNDGAGQSSQVVVRAEVTKGDLLALTAKYRLENRQDIAGMAARAATNMMVTPDEQRFLMLEICATGAAIFSVLMILYALFDKYGRMRATVARNPNNKDQIAADTMLPWWGNDLQYEQQVKRIFVEEWRRARSRAQRQQSFQEGVTRESLPLEEKEQLDLEIFSVTTERLKQMKALATSVPGHQ